MTSIISNLQGYLWNCKLYTNYIDVNVFYENYYKLNKNFLLVDLRNTEDFFKFKIMKSINIPKNDILLNENIYKLPFDKTIF